MNLNKGMLVIDLDGTLLNNEEFIPTTTIELLKKFKSSGTIITVATGRTLWETEIIPSLFDIADYAISSDGANLLDIKNKKYIYNKTFEKTQIEEIMNLVEEEVNYIFYTNEGEFSELPKEYAVTKIKFYFKDSNLITKYENIINTNYKEKYNSIPMMHSDKNSEWLAINLKNADKGFGVKKLKELLNIKQENIIAFGDRNNDISSFKESAIGVAMENATEKVKECADYITTSNEELGVENFLKNIN